MIGDTIDDMVHPELVAYIIEQTKQGMSADALRLELMAAGWRELDVDNALHDVAAGLESITEDASLHEDLAQVRGMVAHLATRVRAVEVRLTSTIPAVALPMQMQLSAPARRFWLGQWMTLVIAAIGFAVLSRYSSGLVGWGSLVPLDQAIIVSAVGLIFLIMGYVAMRIRWPYSAAFLTGMAIAMWASTTRLSWQMYDAMEWSTALGLAVFFIVLALVMGRWIHRSAR